MSGRLRTDARGAARDRYLVQGTIAPRFVEAHAVTAEDAIAFAPTNSGEAKAFAAMIVEGSIRMPREERFYFDMDAYEAAVAARHARRVPVMVVVALLIAAVAVMLYRG